MTELPTEEALPAEVYISRSRGMRRSGMAYRRFATASEALRYIVDDLPDGQIASAVMEVADERYDHAAIRILHQKMGAQDAPDAPASKDDPAG